MIYIIDGYNVIKKLPELDMKRLKDGRERLYSIIVTRKLHKNHKNRVIIVYDGKPDIRSKILKHENVEVIYSHDETADDLIKRLIKNSKNPHDIMLITDDRELKEFAILHSGCTMSVDEFFKRSKIKSDKKIISIKTNLTDKEQKELSEELLKAWENG